MCFSLQSVPYEVTVSSLQGHVSTLALNFRVWVTWVVFIPGMFWVLGPQQPTGSVHL